MSRVQLQPAYVLHGRAFRESSLLLEIFSRDHGRMGVVARGARGSKSRWRGILQPFRPLLLSWSQRGELATLSGADQVAAPPPLAGEALYCGLYVNELLMRLLQRGDPHPELFAHYRETTAEMALGTALQPALRLFEKHLLDASGFGLILDREGGSNTPLRPEAWYDYQPGLGPVRVSEQAGSELGGGGRVVSGRMLHALSSESLSDGDLPALRGMMRRVLRYHLGEQPLASDIFYQAPRNPAGAARNSEET